MRRTMPAPARGLLLGVGVGWSWVEVVLSRSVAHATACADAALGQVVCRGVPAGHTGAAAVWHVAREIVCAASRVSESGRACSPLAAILRFCCYYYFYCYYYRLQQTPAHNQPCGILASPAWGYSCPVSCVSLLTGTSCSLCCCRVATHSQPTHECSAQWGG